jgi:signal transduction histidine kinase
MNETYDRVCALIAQQTGKRPDDALRPLFEELWGLLDGGDTQPDRVQLASAAQAGARLVERGVTASQALREVLAVGRALADEAVASGMDAASARRAAALVDEAAAQLASAIEHARRARRQSWLSFLVHEVKNPLNTVMNALWLLREKGADPTQAGRFLDLAERAVKRLEQRAKDVRQLDEDLQRPPPGWETSGAATRAPAAK